VPVLGDIVLAAMVLALEPEGPAGDRNGCPCPPQPTWAYALVAVQALVLVGRRSWPVTIALISGFLALLYGISTLPDPPVPYAALVAIYTAVRRVAQGDALLAPSVTRRIVDEFIRSRKARPSSAGAEALQTLTAENAKPSTC
jgi:hypothetical protein